MSNAHPLEPLLNPRSVALVGVSPRPGSVGEWLFKTFTRGGYRGQMYLVNPSYETIEGWPCYKDLSELPTQPEMAVLNVGSARIEALFDHAIELGIRAFTIFDYCTLQNDTEPKLLARLRVKARQAGALVCGGGGMGYYNLDTGVHATYYVGDHLKAGHIALIAHSGSVFTVLAMGDPRYRFNLIVSAGSEIATGADEFLSYALNMPSTRVVALFIETVRNPKGLIEALEEARRRAIPVVVCNVGKSEKSKDFALTHTGAIVGSQFAYDALFDRYGVLRADSLDEMMATAALLAQGRPAGPGGVGAVLDSGGLRQLLADLAEKAGVPFAHLGAQTIESIEQVLPHTLTAGNPLDAAGPFSYDYEQVFRHSLRAIVDDPDTALGWFEFDATDDFTPVPAYIDVAKEIGTSTDKPFIVVNSAGATRNSKIAEDLLEAGIPLINSVQSALVAARNLFAHRDFRSRAHSSAPEKIDAALSAKWKRRLGESGNLTEVEALTLLGDFGVPVVESVHCVDQDGVLEAAEDIGYPLALKTAVKGINHKMDVAGVHLNITDQSELLTAYGALCARLGPETTVAAMAPEGVEVGFGMIRDPQFGPLVVVSAGGALIEYLNDRVAMLAPVDEHEAHRALERLAICPILRGVRGARPVDMEAVVHALVKFSNLAATLADSIIEMDVNPLIASESGIVAVDALLIGERAPP